MDVFLLAMHEPALATATEPEIFAFNTDVNCNHAVNAFSRLNIVLNPLQLPWYESSCPRDF
jgi:hypothetical protein